MKYSKENLELAVKNSHSIMGVLRKFGTKMSGGCHGHISKKIKEFGINTSHFTRRGVNKGKSPTNKKHWSKILIKANLSLKKETYRLRRALIESGREYKCEKCGVGDIWNNEKLCIQIDHINGDWSDNRSENLRFLCPNCHSQTNTFGSQNIKSIIKIDKIKNCLKCNKEFIHKHNQKYCSTVCSNRCKKLRKTKICWPNINDLIIMIRNSNYSKVSRELGVSDNAIRKYLKKKKCYCGGMADAIG